MKEKIIKILEEKAECTMNGHADFDNVDVTQFEEIAEEIVKLCNLHFASNNANTVLCVVPIDAQKNGTGKDEMYCNWYDCPKCDNGNVMFEDSYCSKCGCKFEWTGHYA